MRPRTLESVRCSAHSSQTGEPCKRWASHGTTVCTSHGARAAQVRIKAEERLKALVHPAITTLQALLEADSDATRLGAVKDVLDRNGFKPADRHEISGPDGAPIHVKAEFDYEAYAQLFAGFTGTEPALPAADGPVESLDPPHSHP